MSIHVLVADLNAPATTTIDALKVFVDGGGANARGADANLTVDAIACHMAIHYMCVGIANIRNLLTLVSETLKVGGVFVFTTMDGARVFETLRAYNKDQTWELKENSMVKYAITKKYAGAVLSDAGQTIAVKLPFAGGGFYDEPLANISTIIKHAGDFGFELVDNVPFDTILDSFESNNRAMYREMTEADRVYTALHQFVVLKKTK
jgi:hypothetical protein